MVFSEILTGVFTAFETGHLLGSAEPGNRVDRVTDTFCFFLAPYFILMFDHVKFSYWSLKDLLSHDVFWNYGWSECPHSQVATVC